jgi:hypothetical protein
MAPNASENEPKPGVPPTPEPPTVLADGWRTQVNAMAYRLGGEELGQRVSSAPDRTTAIERLNSRFPGAGTKAYRLHFRQQYRQSHPRREKLLLRLAKLWPKRR